MRRKAQIMQEYIAVIGVIVIVFLVAFIFFYSRQREVQEVRAYVDSNFECLRLSNMINGVYSSGDGTTARTSTDFLLTFFNYSLLRVESVANFSIVSPAIAILASEAGESTQSFYNSLTAKLNPSWYKTCFDDLSGVGCQQWQTAGMTVATWNSIPKNLGNLMQEIDNYNVIYLEDSHIQYNAVYNGKTYLQILEDWVRLGNILILAEHVMCREQSTGSYSSTSYRCNPPGSYNSDVWNMFVATLFQRGGAFGNDVTIINQPDPKLFPNLKINDTFDFEEASYIYEIPLYNPGDNESSDNGIFAKNSAGSSHNQGNHNQTAVEDCPGIGSSRDCTDTYAWEVGYDNAAQYANVEFNATLTFNLSALATSGANISNITLEWKGCWNGGTDYCDGGDNPEFRDGTEGYFEALVFNGSQYERLECVNTSGQCKGNNTILLGDENSNPSWGEADRYNTFKFRKTSGFTNNYLVNGSLMQIRFKTRGVNAVSNSDIWQEIDYASLTVNFPGKNASQQNFYIIGTYDSGGKPAMVQWKLGSGTVFYFADFQVEFNQTGYTNILGDLIEKAYLLFTPKREEATCSFYARLFNESTLTRDILIKNVNSEILIQNAS